VARRDSYEIREIKSESNASDVAKDGRGHWVRWLDESGAEPSEVVARCEPLIASSSPNLSSETADSDTEPRTARSSSTLYVGAIALQFVCAVQSTGCSRVHSTELQTCCLLCSGCDASGLARLQELDLIPPGPRRLPLRLRARFDEHEAANESQAKKSMRQRRETIQVPNQWQLE
jgi:hypothetical protein